MGNKMKLNNSIEFDITNYNRYTNIESGRVNSYANFNLLNMDAYDELLALSQGTVNDIRISRDNVEIYHLGNQNGKITSIQENLYDDNLSISVTVNFTKNEDQPQDEEMI